MKSKKQVEQTGQRQDKPAKVSGNSRGGGALDGKSATSTKNKSEGNSTEHVRKPS